MEVRRLVDILELASADSSDSGLPGRGCISAHSSLRLWLRGRGDVLPHLQRDDPRELSQRCEAANERAGSNGWIRRDDALSERVRYVIPFPLLKFSLN